MGIINLGDIQMGKDKKCKDGWKVTVGLNCEQRIGVALENIGKLAHAHCQVHRAENYSSQVQVLNFQAKRPQWGHWCLYCYFVPAEGTVDIVDAVPIQTTKRGREWLELVKLYFNIFGMPWRMREIPYAAMVSAGRAAIEQLMHDIESFIQEKIKFDSHAFERFRSQLHHAEQKMNDYYKTVEIQNQRPARVALENTVYILHELIYDIGEELRLVPRRNEKSVNQNALGILAKKQIFPIL